MSKNESGKKQFPPPGAFEGVNGEVFCIFHFSFFIGGEIF